jgi:serine/threonine-protein kinase
VSDPYDFDADLRLALGDSYVIDRELTGSGMSRVFVATEKALNRHVVVKVLPPELSAGVNRDRFRREIQLAAQLQHPHIVPLHAAGSTGDLLYFTMPFIEGESLRHALHEGVRFSPREVVRILHDVADALAYAHSRGVIHRDIKPGNVLRSGAHAFVTDFGVAKAISAAMPSVGMTTSGMAIGTPAYMAPEQLAGDPAADHRVDIYALGLLGYELLAGEAPFKASSPQETMAAQLTRAPESITKKRPDAPPELAALLSRCLAKNPAERPQAAGEIVTLLDALDVSSGARTPLRAFTPARWWVAGGLLATAGLAFAMLWPRHEPLETPGQSQDSTVVVNTPTVLTREDSLAIARAIQKKVGEQESVVAEKVETARSEAPPAQSTAAAAESLASQMTRFVDSLRRDIQQAVLDSVARVRGSAPRPGVVAFGSAAVDSLMRLYGVRFGEPRRGGRDSDRDTPTRPEVGERPVPNLARADFAERRATLGSSRRVLVAYPLIPRSRAYLTPYVDSLVDSLSAALNRSRRYEVIPQDTVRAALQQTRTISANQERLNVELIVSLQPTLHVDSTIVWQVTTRDVTANASFTTRVAHLRQLPPSLLVGMDTLVQRVAANLREQDLAPRRRPGPDGS